MSQENVEIVKRLLDAFNVRDFDLAAELMTLDFEFISPMFDSEGKSYRGPENAAHHRDFLGTWKVYRLVADEVRDLGDRVLALGRVQGRGRGSGVPVDTPWGAIYDFREGKVSRARPFFDHTEALRAAGLSE